MYNQKKAINDEIKRCEKELSAYEYEYDHNNDAAKRASLVKSIDFWSERTAEAYHRLALCEEDDAYSEHSIFDRIDAESSEAEEMTEDEIEELFSESKAGGYYD